MKLWWRDWLDQIGWPLTILMLICTLLLVGSVVILVRDAVTKPPCIRGHHEPYTWFMPMDFGNGTTMLIPMPGEYFVCDEREQPKAK